MNDTTTYETIQGAEVPIKAWTRGVPFEDAARGQLLDIAKLPIVWPHIAVMPDVHLGIGATVGSVIPTRGAIIPASVGVDLGCGLTATRLDMRADQLPDNPQRLFDAIAAAVPHGGGKGGGKGEWADEAAPMPVAGAWSTRLAGGYTRLLEKHPRAFDKGKGTRPLGQLGTLGGGNHFIEVCTDKERGVWVMLHSGSRGVGNRIGTYFIELAKSEMDRLDRRLPNRDLAYLEEGTEHFADYVEAVGWAQEYAKINREAMMARVLWALNPHLPPHATERLSMVVSCHHNYVQRETHFGESLYVTRKGAVSARAGEMGIIPGSMGTRSFIVRGKGNPESLHSCSHGAGRVMARGVAKRTITLEEHAEATKHVVCRKDSDVIDESPRAYKDIAAVLRAQADLVDIVAELSQILCVKG